MAPRFRNLDLEKSLADLLVDAGLNQPKHAPALTQTLSKLESPSCGKLRMPGWKCLQEGGAAYRIRTCDPIITNDVLYQLS